MAKKIGFLLVVFVACYMAMHFYIRARNRRMEENAPVTKLIECDANDIRHFKISLEENEKKTLEEFNRVDIAVAGMPTAAQLAISDWRFSGDQKGEADSATLSRIASMVCEIYDPIPTAEALRPVFVKGRLVSTQMEFSLLRNGKTENHLIRFGGFTTDRMNMIEYKVGDTAKVYKIQPKLIQTTSQSVEAMRNYKVSRMNPDHVQSATIFFNGKERFTLERDGSDWNLTKSGKVIGRGNEDAGKFVNRIANLKAIGILNPEFPAEKCEGTKHAIKVEFIGVPNKKEAVYFDLFGKNKPLEACSSLRDTKFKVHYSLMDYLDVEAKKLVRSDK